MVTITNQTPHDVHYHHENGKIETFPASKNIIRVKTNESPTTSHRDFPHRLYDVSTGGTEGLPEQKRGHYHIVSQMVVDANPHRDDLVYPHKLVRDEQNRITGCSAFGRRVVDK